MSALQTCTWLLTMARTLHWQSAAYTYNINPSETGGGFTFAKYLIHMKQERAIGQRAIWLHEVMESEKTM